DLGIGLDARDLPFADHVGQSAGAHIVLAEAGQDVGDVVQVGVVRADEQDSSPAVTQPRVGVQQVGGAVQGDDGLAGAGTAVDHQRPARAGSDDGVLIGGDRGQHVPHLRGACLVQGGQQGGFLIGAGVCGQLRALVVGSAEGLVPVVTDAAAAPAVAAPACQAHRVCAGGGGEGLGDRRAPVHQQWLTVLVVNGQPADLDGIGSGGRWQAGPDGVELKAAQPVESILEMLDPCVALDSACRVTGLLGQCRLEVVLHIGDVGTECLGNGGEVSVVACDALRCGLGRMACGQVES